ncbi:hypothetical protein QU38_00465, partial [Staphylococcus aureus]
GVVVWAAALTGRSAAPAKSSAAGRISGSLACRRSVAQRAQLDELIGAGLVDPDLVGAAHVLGRDAHRLHLDQPVRRQIGIADRGHLADIGGSDADRLELHGLVGGEVAQPRAGHVRQEFGRDAERLELDQV